MVYMLKYLRQSSQNTRCLECLISCNQSDPVYWRLLMIHGLLTSIHVHITKGDKVRQGLIVWLEMELLVRAGIELFRSLYSYGDFVTLFFKCQLQELFLVLTSLYLAVWVVLGLVLSELQRN